MSIKLAQLRVFVEVALQGNIKDAAEKLSRTPSAVSMSLKQLEDELGAPLFESDRKSALTALGEYVLSVARAEVRGFERSVRTIEAFARNEAGRLDIACVPSVGSQLLPDILPRFLAARPKVQLDLRDADTGSVSTAVERQHVELGICGEPLRPGPFDFEPLFRDQFVAVFSAHNHLARGRKPVSWLALSRETFIINGASEAIRDEAYIALSRRSLLMVHNTSSLLSMLRRDIGVTILPSLSVSRDDAGLRTRPLPNPSLFRTVGLLTHAGRSLSPVAEAFAAHLRTDIRAGIGDGMVEPVEQ